MSTYQFPLSHQLGVPNFLIRNDSALVARKPLLHYTRSTMTATLENAAKNLLSDPPWMRVFKNTYDSIEDQLNKVLVTAEYLVLIVNCLLEG